VDSGFISIKSPVQSFRLLRKSLVLDKETERLVNEVKRELRALRMKIDQRDDPKLLKTYRKIRSTLD
jgi:hypothetical protein